MPWRALLAVAELYCENGEPVRTGMLSGDRYGFANNIGSIVLKPFAERGLLEACKAGRYPGYKPEGACW